MEREKIGLRVVSSDLPDPPYAADTKSGAFPFDVDVERLTASDTWDLMPSDLRPWWLFLLTMSWRQVPCGSFRDDEEIIAAKIGASESFVHLHRKHLLRGWYKCTDGRLYHPVIRDKVRSFIGQRNKWRRQKINNIPGNSAGNPRSSARTPPSSSPSSSSSSSPSSSSSLPDSQKLDERGCGGKQAKERAEKKPVKRFVKPAVEEVRAYCAERGNCVDAESFCDFYEAKGWKVGKNGMKNWKAAVRTWEKRNDLPSGRTDRCGGTITEQVERIKADIDRGR